MYSKPTTICSSIALEKGVLVAASGIPTECKILMPVSEEKDVFGVNPFKEPEEGTTIINW